MRPGLRLCAFPCIFYSTSYKFDVCYRKFDQRIVIHKNSNDAVTTKQTALISVVQGFYPIELHHIIDGGQPSCALQFTSDVMPLQSIVAPDISCCVQHLSGSPFLQNVRSSSPCAALSVITASTSLWTAGSVGTVEITMKDVYGNFLDSWDNRWHVFMSSTSPAALTEFASVPVREGKQSVNQGITKVVSPCCRDSPLEIDGNTHSSVAI
jgi:hypothetical protein